MNGEYSVLRLQKCAEDWSITIQGDCRTQKASRRRPEHGREPIPKEVECWRSIRETQVQRAWADTS